MHTYYTDVRTQLLTENVDERLIQIVEYVVQYGSIDNNKVQQLFNVSKPTATRILQQTDSWLVMQDKGRKGTVYHLKW